MNYFDLSEYAKDGILAGQSTAIEALNAFEEFYAFDGAVEIDFDGIKSVETVFYNNFFDRIFKFQRQGQYSFSMFGTGGVPASFNECSNPKVRGERPKFNKYVQGIFFNEPDSVAFGGWIGGEAHRDVIKHITSNYQDTITSRDAADVLGCTPNYGIKVLNQIESCGCLHTAGKNPILFQAPFVREEEHAKV